MSFLSVMGKEAGLFKGLPKSSRFLICAHFDCDGICSAAIFSQMMDYLGMRYDIVMRPFLDKRTVNELSKRDMDYYIFLDMGSSKLSIIDKIPAKKIYVLDHHTPESYGSGKIIHINAQDFDSTLSGAGVAYLFARDIDPEAKSELAIIGAIGDAQGKRGFTGLNKEILEHAKKRGKIQARDSIRLFGTGKRTLPELLKHTDDPYIPGVTGNEHEARAFLCELGIPIKKEDEHRYYRDLSDDELDLIAEGIISKRQGCKDPEDIFGPVYILPDEEYDAKEFATILNACGKMGRTDIGLDLCRGKPEAKDKASEISGSYKDMLTGSIEWARKNIISEDGVVMINAKDEIPADIIGTVSSILSYSDMTEEGDIILSMARKKDTHETKISMRVKGRDDLDLSMILRDITKKIGNVSGGHRNAAGAVIPTAQEDYFIEEARKVLKGCAVQIII